MQTSLFVIALSLAARFAAAQSTAVEIETLAKPLIQQRLEAVTRELRGRRATLEALFREAGCLGENLTSLKVPGSAEPDVLCTLPGQDPAAGTIVVGGHYDAVPAGMGAVDDWSGAALLPSLYQSLKMRPRRHTYVFAAFSGEEVGLHGSKAYVQHLSKSARAEVRAMINLECLGVSLPKVWAHRADKRLLGAYAAVAKSIGIEAVASNVEKLGDDDSHPFLDAKIPVLTIHSITQENYALLHTAGDQVSAIHPDDYYAAYRLAAVYLGFLDGFLGEV